MDAIIGEVDLYRDTLTCGAESDSPNATTLPSPRLRLVCGGIFSSGHRLRALDDRLDPLTTI